ncbi:MAG: hypothetical protein WAT39_00400 [Planctomycetota bacterium]
MPAREQATSSHRENLDRWHYISRASDAQFANHLGASDRAEPATVEKEFEVNPRKPAVDRVRADAPVSFVPMGAVDAERGAITAPEERPFGAVRKGYTAFADGDVLLAKITPCFENGKAAVASSLRNGLGFGSSEFHVFRPQGAVLAPYLFHFLRQPQLRADAAEFMTGTAGQARVPTDHIRGLELPIAPLDEQHRVVVRIEALLNQVRRAKNRLDRVPRILKRFRQAVLAAALSGKLTEEWRQGHPEPESVEARQQRLGATSEMPRRRRGRGTTGLSEWDPPSDLPESWLVDSVRGLVERGVILDFQDGNHGSLYPRASEFGDSGTKFITAKQVFDGRVLHAEAPLLANDRAAQLRIGFARPGDVLLTHNATVGRVAVLPEDAGNCVLGTSVTYYRLRSELMLPTFCMHFMQSRLWQRQLEQVMEQTTRNQVSVRKQAEFWMVAPPPDEQAVIATRVEALLGLAAAIEQRVERAAVRAVSLPQAILSKAFAGELVPTEAELARTEGRDYETAEQLLSRAQREAAVQAPVGRTRRSARVAK